MKEAVAILFAIVLIALGWDQSYQNQYVAVRRSFATISGMRLPQLPNTASFAPGTPEPQAAPAPAPGGDKSWMWQRSTLDSNKQAGVDRDGVHTFEPMMKNNNLPHNPNTNPYNPNNDPYIPRQAP